MNQKELRIISHLRKDARNSLASISHTIDMPISTVYDKLNRLQRNDVIQQFTTLVDFAKLGYHHRAKLAVKVDRSQRDDLLLFLQQHSALNSLCEINSGFDFFIETVHKDVKGYTTFVDQLKESFTIEVQEFQILNDLVRERFTPTN